MANRRYFKIEVIKLEEITSLLMDTKLCSCGVASNLMVLIVVSFVYLLAIFGLYRVRGSFGGDFNLVVWQIFIGSPNLNHAVLTRTHKMN